MFDLSNAWAVMSNFGYPRRSSSHSGSDNDWPKTRTAEPYVEPDEPAVYIATDLLEFTKAEGAAYLSHRQYFDFQAMRSLEFWDYILYKYENTAFRTVTRRDGVRCWRIIF